MNRTGLKKGDVFGKLKIVEEVTSDRVSGRTRRKVLCVCECGAKKEFLLENLRSKNTQSCGCLQKQQVSKTNSTHSRSKTRLYRIWSNMKTRCDNTNNRAYKWYGARGIKYDQSWSKFDKIRFLTESTQTETIQKKTAVGLPGNSKTKTEGSLLCSKERARAIQESEEEKINRGLRGSQFSAKKNSWGTSL